MVIYIKKRINFLYFSFQGFIIGAILRHTGATKTKKNTLRLNYSTLPKNTIPNWVSFE
jgi:hypothetical protein